MLLIPSHLHLRLKPTNSTCTLTSQPAEAVDYEIIPAQFRPSPEVQNIAEQIGRAGPEGQLVLGDALLCFWIS